MRLTRGAYGTSQFGGDQSPWGGTPNGELIGQWGESPFGADFGGRIVPVTAGGFGNEAWGVAPFGGLSYADVRALESRSPCWKIVLALDTCGNWFGSQPCAATGEPCYNTYLTCKDKTHYQRASGELLLTSADVPPPFRRGERPYVTGVTLMPTEISDGASSVGRTKIACLDEPDGDIGIDPYVDQRASVQGTFWKKLLARNANYESRRVYVYHGFSELAEADWQPRFAGTLANIQDGDGKCELEAADLIKSLKDVKLPAKIDAKLVNDTTDTQTELWLSSIDGLESGMAYLKIGDEIVWYDGMTPSLKKLTGVRRGELGTTAAAYSSDEKVSLVLYYPLANMFDRMVEILNDAGLEAEFIEQTDFDFWRDMPGGEPPVSALITEETTADVLYFELVDLADCKSWQNEAQKITIKRNLPNLPGRSYSHLREGENILAGSCKVDRNADSRISRAFVYWGKKAIKTTEEDNDYRRRDIGVDAEMEGENAYNAPKEKKYACRWLRLEDQQEEIIAAYLAAAVKRRVWRQKDPLPAVTVEVGLKDEHILTGHHVLLSHSALLNTDGSSFSNVPFEVLQRDPKDRKISLKLQMLCKRRVAFFAPADAPDYTAASIAQREYGYFCNTREKMPDESEAYCFW